VRSGSLAGLTPDLKAYRDADRPVSTTLARRGGMVPIWWLLHSICQPYTLPAAILFVLLAVSAEIVAAVRYGSCDPAYRISNGLLLAGYISLFGGLSALRHFPLTRARNGTYGGLRLTLALTFCVWAADTAALFVGRRLGRTKLAPQMSPGKTVEGAAAGFLASLLLGAFLGGYLVREWVLGSLLGIVAGTLGQMGDLFESAVKRELATKDLGTLIPGHGGVMDRFDSLLFAAPAAYAVSLLVSWTGARS